MPAPSPAPLLALALGLAAAGCNGAQGEMTFAKVEAGEPTFGDITVSGGLAFTSVSRQDAVGYGQGAAVADFDGDGDLDVFFTQDLGPCALFRSEFAVAFTEIAAAAGVQVDPAEAHAKAAAAFDYDRDGRPDLFVGTTGEGNHLYRNRGDGTFEETTAAAGIGGGALYTLSAVPGDFDGDGWTDLYEVNCVPTDYAAPFALATAPAPNRLWRNNGDGTFTDVAPALGVDDPLAGWAAQWMDVEGDGDQDLLLANDVFFYPGTDTRDRVFVNGGPGAGFAFEERGADFGLAEPHSGMGFAVGDLDGDGVFDLYVSDFGGNELRLGGDPLPWPDRAPALGMAVAFDAMGRRQVTWGCHILDWNSDGRNDLLVFNGILAATDPGPAYGNFQLPRLFLARTAPAGTPPAARANGLVFEEVAAAAGLHGLGAVGARGVVPADLDRDGDLDLVVPTRVGPARLVRNDTPRAGPWYGVRLRGTRSPPEGWGAILELRVGTATWRQLLSAGGMCGSALVPERVFTPGPLARGKTLLTVRWPSGTVQEVEPRRDAWTTVVEPL